MIWNVKEILNKLKLSFDRSFSGLIKHQLLWMFLFVLLALFVLFLLFIPDLGERPLHQIFSSLFVDMISPVSLRSLAYDPQSQPSDFFRLLLVYVVGMIFVSGLLIATLSNAIRTRADSFRNGLTSYSFSNHIVVLGYDDSVVYLVQDLLARNPQSMVMIGVSDQVSSRRNFVKGYLSQDYAKRVVVVRCQNNSLADLSKLNLQRAKSLYILGEDGSKERDAQNLMTYHSIVQICKKNERREGLCCHVLVKDSLSFALSKMGNVEVESKEPYYELITMNPDEMWSCKVLVDNCSKKHEISYPILDRGGIDEDSDSYVHLVVLGMSDMGYSMALTAAHIAHYPNFVTKQLKSKITFVDADAHKKMLEFKLKHKYLFDHSNVLYHQYSEGVESNRQQFVPKKDFLDIEWEFCQVPDFDSSYLDVLGDVVRTNPHEYLTIAVCYDSQKLCQDVAFYMPETFYEYNIPIFYRDDILYSYEKELFRSEKYNNIYPFGMLDESYLSDEKLFDRAKKLNYLYENISDKEVVLRNDAINASWKNLSIVKKWSNIYGVMSLDSYVRSVNSNGVIPAEISRREVEIMSEVEHNRWNVEELLLGYRPTTEGEDAEILKDKAKKNELKKRYIHCDIKPYSDLKNVSGEAIYLYDSIKILNLQFLLGDDKNV